MKMKEWRAEERPREKLLSRGATELTNAELLAILIQSGSNGRNAVDVAQELLSSAGGSLMELCARPPGKLMAHKSIGKARAVSIAAALELGRRCLSEAVPRKAVVTGPRDVFRFMLPTLKGRKQEECWILYLNRTNSVIGKEKLTTGTVDATLIDTKLIVSHVLERQAKAVILVHNHPSGSPLPGEADIKATLQLKKALQTFETQLYDHVIVADGAYYSFQDERVCKLE